MNESNIVLLLLEGSTLLNRQHPSDPISTLQIRIVAPVTLGRAIRRAGSRHGYSSSSRKP
jgi:hypothetical protein